MLLAMLLVCGVVLLVGLFLIYIFKLAEVAVGLTCRFLARKWNRWRATSEKVQVLMAYDDGESVGAPSPEPARLLPSSPGDSDASSPWRMPSPGGTRFRNVRPGRLQFISEPQ